MQNATLWRNPNFRLPFAASTVTHLGAGVTAVALPWLATLLASFAFLLGTAEVLRDKAAQTLLS